MSSDTPILPEDPAVLKAMIAALQAENAKMAATIRAHDQLIQALRLRIAKLKKQAFGKSSEKIEREIEQLELALEDLLIASAESATTPAVDEGPVCLRLPRGNGASSTRAAAARIAAVTCASWAKT
jgi:transposase